jgi:hypothetical protein
MFGGGPTEQDGLLLENELPISCRPWPRRSWAPDDVGSSSPAWLPNKGECLARLTPQTDEACSDPVRIGNQPLTTLPKTLHI